jgi:hypothetical protein
VECGILLPEDPDAKLKAKAACAMTISGHFAMAWRIGDRK